MNPCRGDLVTATFPGDLKKPRPAVVMQTNEFITDHRTLPLCLPTTYRSSLENGLEHRPEAMIDKISPIRKDGIGKRIGAVSDDDLLRPELALITIAGLDRYLIFDEPKPED